MIKTFRHWYKQYLKISKKDRNGIVVLSLLIVLMIIINISVGFIKTNKKNDYAEFEKALDEWENNLKSEPRNFQLLFSFNPNTITEQSMDSLALPSFIKRNILSYRNAGGKIKSVTDFRKIYGMNDSIFETVKDFLFFDSPVEGIVTNNILIHENNTDEIQKRSNSKELNAAIFKIELNSTDSIELIKLNGIGPVFASRIIKYRDLLGGYYKKEQLLEVYNFPEETFKSIENNLEADPEKIKRMRLNFVDFSELLRHPYLEKEHAQVIINYRDKHGAFQSVNELFDKKLLDSLTFLKIEPYLECR
jgi:DNA uptake protein ComE-like DNA-binding protein